MSIRLEQLDMSCQDRLMASRYRQISLTTEYAEILPPSTLGALWLPWQDTGRQQTRAPAWTVLRCDNPMRRRSVLLSGLSIHHTGNRLTIAELCQMPPDRITQSFLRKEWAQSFKVERFAIYGYCGHTMLRNIIDSRLRLFRLKWKWPLMQDAFT
ncbi:MAG: hypothetical protein JJ869_11630 [Marivita sp.]|uniref:hypothetical protein n=1 Tax=Marivita sp. TaxID=2003365 RepID=UPI001B158714|nr:hypothetical protein [Marivita sp.]MBO6884214.1 hypothetical protein [Marivita sp.]